MQVIRVVADLRVMWIGKDEKLKFQRYLPPRKFPIDESPTVADGDDLDSSKPTIEELDGYYIINQFGHYQKLDEEG